MTDAPPLSPPYYWFLTLAPHVRIWAPLSDAGRTAVVVLKEAPMTSATRADYGVRVGGAAGGILRQKKKGLHRWPGAESNFQRIVGALLIDCCRWSFRQFASSPNP